MHTIWKFQVPASDTFKLELPVGAQFLDVQMQQGSPQCWFLLDPTESSKEERLFVLVGTGHPVPEEDKLTHLGTFQLHGGQLVFHLFEYR